MDTRNDLAGPLTNFDAALVDLDGVVTRTATVHARAWKRMFDAYLKERGKREGRAFEPFDEERDYEDHVDGRPRHDGVTCFLVSRGVELPEGDPSDDGSCETICGLGNRKDAIFRELLARGGVEVFEDAVQRIRDWHQWGLATAVVSSSRNCEAILDAAGLDDLFDVCVDGVEAEQQNLRGKPAPDTYLEAARRLDVDPFRAIVLEDSVAGVEAGRTGMFGLVIGVDRTGHADALLEHGADIVAQNLSELQQPTHITRGSRRVPALPLALDHFDEITRRLDGKKPAVFLDYDGTMTPIVARPAQAVLSETMRDTLARLASQCTVAIVSGRDRADVESLVQLDRLIYAGSHGFDISGPGGFAVHHVEATASLPALEAAEHTLRERLRAVPGVLVERKRFAVAVHYRNVPNGQVHSLLETFDDVLQEHQDLLCKHGGKKVLELRPNVEWDKGRAVHLLYEPLSPSGNRADELPIYLGDDEPDEDAFRAVEDYGVTILVAETDRPTAAKYRLRSVQEVQEFLRRLCDWRERGLR